MLDIKFIDPRDVVMQVKIFLREKGIKYDSIFELETNEYSIFLYNKELHIFIKRCEIVAESFDDKGKIEFRNIELILL